MGGVPSWSHYAADLTSFVICTEVQAHTARGEEGTDLLQSGTNNSNGPGQGCFTVALAQVGIMTQREGAGEMEKGKWIHIFESPSHARHQGKPLRTGTDLLSRICIFEIQKALKTKGLGFYLFAYFLQLCSKLI